MTCSISPDRDLTPGRLQQSPYAARTYMKENAGPANFLFSNAAQASHMESLAILVLSGRYIVYLPHFARLWRAVEMKSLLPMKPHILTRSISRIEETRKAAP